MVRLTAVRHAWGRLLYALAREIRPRVCLEIRTSFGISGAYVLAGLRRAGGGRFLTLEGSRARAEIASDTLLRLGFSGFEIRVGDFDRQLEPAVADLDMVGLAFVDGNHQLEPTLRYDRVIRERMPDGGVIAHDDIRWSPDMREAWRRVAARESTRLTFDLFRVGVLELGHRGHSNAPLPAFLGISAHR